MNPQIIIDVLIGLAVIGFVAYRQIAWSKVNPRKLMMMPVILGAVGLINLKDALAGPHAFTALDGWFILGQTVLAVALGLVMGTVTKFRTDGGVTSSRAGALGAGLWIAFIAVRLGADALAHASGAGLAASTGVILLTVAVNRFTQNALVLSRFNAHRDAHAPQPVTAVR